MSNVIGFLETLGSRPALSPADYANGVALLDAEGPQRQALLNRDQKTLNELLDGRGRMLCVVCTPEQEEPVETPDDDDSDMPDRDDPEPEPAPK